MLLLDLFKKQGENCFKYRGQLPIFLFLLVIPFILFTDYSMISKNFFDLSLLISVLIILLGLIVRFYTIATTLKGTSGRNRDSQVAESLNTKGIYSLVSDSSCLGLVDRICYLGSSIK